LATASATDQAPRLRGRRPASVRSSREEQRRADARQRLLVSTWLHELVRNDCPHRSSNWPGRNSASTSTLPGPSAAIDLGHAPADAEPAITA
jgi:hypothetical protein